MVDPYREASAATLQFPGFGLELLGDVKVSAYHLVEQEEEIGQCDCEVEPPPVWEQTSQGSEDEESHTEGKLVSEVHCPLIVWPNKFCNCEDKLYEQK